MVNATANLHSLFLHDAHARSSLACVEHASVCTLKLLHIFACHCGNAAHALHHVEHQTLSLQQRAHLTRNAHCNVAFLNLCTILDEHLNSKLFIEMCKDAFGHFHACKHAIFFNDKNILTHRILGDRGESRVVTIANILGKRELYKFLNQFFFYVHSSLFIISCEDKNKKRKSVEKNT